MPLLTSQALGISQNIKGNELNLANSEQKPIYIPSAAKVLKSQVWPMDHTLENPDIEDSTEIEPIYVSDCDKKVIPSLERQDHQESTETELCITVHSFNTEACVLDLPHNIYKEKNRHIWSKLPQSIQARKPTHYDQRTKIKPGPTEVTNGADSTLDCLNLLVDDSIF